MIGDEDDITQTLAQEKFVKRAFEILLDRAEIEAVLTRDSVCAGDDSEAPHEKVALTPSFLDPVAFVQHVSSGYLPTVAGVGHSWTCILNDVKVAEIRTHGIRSLVRETPFQEDNKVHFVYCSASH